MTAALVLVALAGTLTVASIAVMRHCGHVRMWPAVLLMLSAPLENYRADIGPGNLSAFRVAVVIAVIGTGLDVWRSGEWRRWSPVVPVPLLLVATLVVVQIVSVTAVTTAPSLGSRFMLQYIVGGGAALVVFSRIRRDEVLVAAGAFAASLALPAAASVFRVLWPLAPGSDRSLPGLGLLPLNESIEAARTRGSFLLEGIQRQQGTFSDPNHFAFFVAVCALVLFGLFVALARRQAWVLASTCALALLGALLLVLGSYSRSSWLLVVVAGAIWLATAGRSVLRGRAARRTVAVTGLLVLVSLPVIVPVVLDRISPSDRGTEISNSQHKATMSLAVRLAEHHPVEGVGLGAYGSYAHQPALVSSSHSTLLTTAAELGLPGLLLLVSVMGVTAVFGVRSGLRDPDLARRAVVCAVAAGYAGMAVANIAYEVWADDFQWVLFGLLMALTAQPVVRLPLPRRVAIA